MNFDQTLLYFLNQTLANPTLDTIMWIATVWGLWFPLAVGIGYTLWGNKRMGLMLIVTLGASFVLTFTFYYLAMRPRPVDVRLILPTPGFPSFPSGHATMAFGCATVWAAATKRSWGKAEEEAVPTVNQIAINQIAITIAYVIAGLIAVSRLYLGHHYPTDVLAGAVLGTSIGAAVYGTMTSDGHWVPKLRWLLWPQIAIAILVTMMAYLNILPIHLLRFPYADKCLHFLLFGAISFWLQLWWPNRRLGWGNLRIPLSILIPITVALVEEGFQMLSPLRTASLLDLGADAAGMLFFYLLAQKLLSWSEKISSKSKLI